MIHLIAAFLFLLVGASLILFAEAQLFHIGWLVLMASVAAVITFIYQLIRSDPIWQEPFTLPSEQEQQR